MPPKKKGGKGKDDKPAGEEHLTRIAIVNAERCKPKKCRQECKKSCPVVKLGKLCIEVGGTSKLAFISEPLCIGTYSILYIVLQYNEQIMIATTHNTHDSTHTISISCFYFQ